MVVVELAKAEHSLAPLALAAAALPLVQRRPPEPPPPVATLVTELMTLPIPPAIAPGVTFLAAAPTFPAAPRTPPDKLPASPPAAEATELNAVRAVWGAMPHC
eukprot:CAMPEP_0172302008 /NCGR_PEP_ID=MMETSP1058-20130122/3781_1 /TAXON_ID=83371 /ORGANISM="Detonula confervacea, Strain CCMP 353" /LENGTH=102 /DNA_ID=CAMNT_0013012333 /DNA_START=163 /DNA_END=472 /DNA_ORIENTATION=-